MKTVEIKIGKFMLKVGNPFQISRRVEPMIVEGAGAPYLPTPDVEANLKRKQEGEERKMNAPSDSGGPTLDPKEDDIPVLPNSWRD